MVQVLLKKYLLLFFKSVFNPVKKSWQINQKYVYKWFYYESWKSIKIVSFILIWLDQSYKFQNYLFHPLTTTTIINYFPMKLHWKIFNTSHVSIFLKYDFCRNQLRDFVKLLPVNIQQVIIYNYYYTYILPFMGNKNVLNFLRRIYLTS